MKPAADWLPEIFRTASGGWDEASMGALVVRIQNDARADLQNLRQRICTVLAGGKMLTRTQIYLQIPDTTLKNLSVTLTQMAYAGQLEKAGQCRWKLTIP